MTNPAENAASTLYLWPLRTLYVGRVGRLSELSQGAHALLFGLEGPAQISIGEQMFSFRSVLVPAGTLFKADSLGAPIACCFLDPLGRDFLFHQPLMQRHESGLYINSRHEGEQLQALNQVYQQGMSAPETYAILSGKLFPHADAEVEGFTVDERIARVVELIRSDPAENISNDELGAQVGLSGARLQRLFKQTTGIPIRRYRLWHRLFVTASMMAMGSTLTDAALAAGFSDSSHLNHVFKSMFGMKPSTVLRRTRQMRILVGADN